jgi:hypothetical protein
VKAEVHINDEPAAGLDVVRLTQSYVESWTAELAHSGRHDSYPCRLNDWVYVRDVDTGEVLFRGNVTEISPRGVADEGVDVLARGRRFRLENEPVNVNGAGFYIWNRRGHLCGHDSGEDSPGRDGGKWTCGEIIVDILEHALGLPAGGSAIPGHHSSPGCITGPYLDTLDVVDYEAADWLGLDSVCGEFSVDNTSVADAISALILLNGGCYGWFIDPYGVLRLIDMASLPSTEIRAGQLGHWQDEEGTDYRLLDNRLEWTLEGVYSRVMVQGTDRAVEVKPANLDGCGNVALNGGGEMELVARPWKSYPCAYRSLDQPYRHWTGRSVGFSGSCEDWRNTCECGVPAGLSGITLSPRIYKGTATGPKQYLTPPHSGLAWRVNLLTGLVMFAWDVPPTLEPDEKLWGWHWARVPFTVTAGPAGTAYECSGHERTLKVYDPAFRHPTSWPIAGTPDDETAMQTLAERLLDQVKDIRIQGRILCDEVDPAGLDILKRCSVLNLAAPTGGQCSPDPLDWAHLGLNIVEAVYDFGQNTTELTLANTLFMLEGYSEMKRRMKLNLFARRELALSEDLVSCQIGASSSSPDDGPTVTEWPTTTSSTSSTSSTSTSTTSTSSTSTTTLWCQDCRGIQDRCYRVELSGLCGTDWTGCEADLIWSHEYPDPTGLYRCGWTGQVNCGSQGAGGAELVWHVLAGWLIIIASRTWRKDSGAMDYCDPTGAYTCTSGAGTATVTEMPCGCADLLTDDFNRADSADPGADWETSCATGAACRISGQRLEVYATDTVSDWRGCQVTHATPLCTSDHEVSADWGRSFSGSTRWHMHVQARACPGVGLYRGRLKEATDGTDNDLRQVQLWTPGTGSVVLAEDTNAVVPGTWTLRMHSTSIRWIRNGVVQLSATDSTVASGDRHGLLAAHYGAVPGEEQWFDNYRAERYP